VTASLPRRIGRALAASLALLLAPIPAAAQSVLRDAETEAFFQDMAAPIVAAAGFNPRAIDLVLLNDPSINAFVAGCHQSGHPCDTPTMASPGRLTRASVSADEYHVSSTSDAASPLKSPVEIAFQALLSGWVNPFAGWIWPGGRWHGCLCPCLPWQV
jgi:hypothetical protein